MADSKPEYISTIERLENDVEPTSSEFTTFLRLKSPLSAVLSAEQFGDSVRLSLVVMNESGEDWFLSEDNYVVRNGFAIYREGQRVASAPDYTELGRPAIFDSSYSILADDSIVTLQLAPLFLIDDLMNGDAHAHFVARFSSRQMLPSLAETLREQGLNVATVVRSNEIEFTCKRVDQGFICTF